MNGPENSVKRFALSSSPFIKGLMLFSLRGWEFPDHQARELIPDECFNPPLELFLQVLDGRFRHFALILSVSPLKLCWSRLGHQQCRAPAQASDVDASCLLRVKSNRVFYRPAPERLPGQKGASRKDG